MRKIKYTKLDELMNENKIDIRNGKVNLFINLEPVINSLVTKQIDDYLRVKNESKIFQIIANIINLAAHYRLYFSSRRIESKVYMYIQHPFDSVFNNQQYNPDYRRVYTFRYVDNINNFVICDNITAALPLIKIILEYIEGVYIIESGSVENSVIPYILHDDNSTNLILSTKMYDMQYCAYGFSILYPKQDDSVIISRDNIINKFGRIYKTDMGIATYKQLPFILSMVGDTDRNIYGVKGIGLKRASSLISGAIEHNIISKDIDNINMIIPIVKKCYQDKILSNFCCTDILSQYKDCSKKDIYDINSQIVDRFDNDALKKLNDTHFEEYPLMLEAITSKPRKQNSVVF